MFLVGHSLAKGIEQYDPKARYPISNRIEGKRSSPGLKAVAITELVLMNLAALVLLGSFLAFAFTGSIVPAIIAAGCTGFLLIQLSCIYGLKKYIQNYHPDLYDYSFETDSDDLKPLI